MKLKLPKIGRYVMVTWWPDVDPVDPFYIGFLEKIVIEKNGIYYKVQGSSKLWRHCFSISKEEGRKYLEFWGEK